MTSDNETVEQVCEVLNRYPKAEVCDEDGLTVLNNNIIAKRIIAAHLREVAKLRECLKEACRYRCVKCNFGNLETESHFCGNYCDTIKRWHKALEGANNGK